MSYNNQGVTVHPNRVFVKELPVDVDRDELKAAFSGFGLRIRTARVVETNGSTNYGFLTFDSKGEADQVIQRARSDQGILVRGKRIAVDQAFSRRNPPRKNSRQFSQALQGIFDSVGAAPNAGIDDRQQFMRPDCNQSYNLRQDQGRTNHMQYPWHQMCYEGSPVYLTTANPGLPQHQTGPRAGQHLSFHQRVPGHPNYVDDVRQSSHWPVSGGHYPYDTMKTQHQRYDGLHPSYVQSHHPGLSGQLYVETPAEGAEAPHGTEWSPQAESASTDGAEFEASTGYHQHDQTLSHHIHSQLQHHPHLLQQHLAQQQNQLNPAWVQYAHYHQPSPTRRDSESSNN